MIGRTSLLFLLVVCPLRLTAQESPTPTEPIDSLSHPGTRRTVDAQVLAKLPIEDINDALRLQTGVLDLGDFRGLVVRGGRPGEALVRVDGVPVANWLEGRQQFLRIPKNAFERVDLLLGGIGAEYGPGASGVMELTTRAPGQRLEGSLSFETDEALPLDGYGFGRLQAHLSGPLFGRALGFTVTAAAVGRADADPTFSGNDLGSLALELADGTAASVPLGPTRWFRETGVLDTIRADGTVLAAFKRFAEIADAGVRKPYNNGDEYALNLGLHFEPSERIRIRTALSLSRAQRRFFDPLFAFRPQALSGLREKSWQVRAEVSRRLFERGERSASFRLVIGLGREEAVQGFLGKTLADTAAVRDGSQYTLWGDVFGFTFSNFRFPFEDAFTVERWLARFDSMRVNPALDYLVPFATQRNPNTGEPFTLGEAQQFRLWFGPDNPFGSAWFWNNGYAGYGYRAERTLFARAELDWRFHPAHRVELGVEYTRKRLERIGGAGRSDHSNTSPLGDVWRAEPGLTGLWLKDVVRLGASVWDLGVRLEAFAPNASFPKVPGFTLPVSDPVTGETILPEFVDAKTHWDVSPRLAGLLPLGRLGELRASYGIFTQVPPLDRLYAGMNLDLNKALTSALTSQVFGRPLDPSRAVVYEVGIRRAFGPWLSADVVAFSHERRGDLAPVTIVVDLPNQPSAFLRVFDNRNNGRARGVETRLSRSFGRALRLELGYAILDAEDRFEGPTYTNPVTGEPARSPTIVSPSAFEAEHAVSGHLLLRTPSTGAETAGLANLLMRNWTMALAVRARSGLSYVPSRTEGSTASGIGPDPIYTVPLEYTPLPWTSIMDLRIGREVRLGRHSVVGFIDARNALNRRNIVDVFTRTGSPDDPGQSFVLSHTALPGGGAPLVLAEVTDPPLRALLERRERLFGDGDGVLSTEEQLRSALQSFLASGWGPLVGALPQSFFGSPRQVRIGIEWRF